MGNINDRRALKREQAEQVWLSRSDGKYYKLKDILPLDSATGIIITTREALSGLFIEGIVQTSLDQKKVFVTHPDQAYFDYGRVIENKLTDILYIDPIDRESFLQKIKSLEATILNRCQIEQPDTYKRGLNLVSIASQSDLFANILQELGEKNEELKDKIEAAIIQIRKVVVLAHMLSHDLVHLLEAQARGQDPYYLIESESLLQQLDNTQTNHSVAIRFMYPQHMLEELITMRLQGEALSTEILENIMSQLRHKPGKFLNPQYIKVDKLTQRVSQIVGSNRFAQKYHAAHTLAHAAIQYTQGVYQLLVQGNIMEQIRKLGITSTEVNGEKEKGIKSEAVLAICADIVTSLLKSQHKNEREEVQYGQGNFYSGLVFAKTEEGNALMREFYLKCKKVVNEYNIALK